MVFFEKCKIVGSEFYKCDKKFFCIHFKKTILMGCNFSDLKMKVTEFIGCKVNDCYFKGTLLMK